MLFAVAAGWLASIAAAEEPPRELPTQAAAREQAELLHDSLRATLTAIHHQYFREDEGIAIPAAALREVFDELARQRGIEIRWLAVNAPAMNVDHEAKSEFEKQAVRALAKGAEHYEAIDVDRYQRVEAIALTSECLKCHVPSRTNTKDRIAGLLIAMPIRPR